MIRAVRRLSEITATLTVVAALLAGPLLAQRGGGAGGGATALPSIEDKTSGMERLDGFLPLYWDADLGQLWMEIPRLNQEMIHYMGYGAGLGSNDLGLDRGALRGTSLVKFERVGRKILMVQPNYRFRATSDNPDEVRAVRDAFARSVLWGFTPEAETAGRVLVDMTAFLIRDAVNAGGQMQPGTYRLDNSRSTIYMEMTNAFPANTEMEVELTFVQQPGAGGGGRGGRGGGGFEGVGQVAASGEAASIRLHHSFVELPDDNYEPRAYDPRAGYGASTYQEYSAGLGEDMTQRAIRRHRLEKRNPSAAISDPVEPIVYYLDPGTPEPVRSALLDGARWWNQAFEAAGYRNAFQVVMRPDSISSLDARYNVINWVHRSTRGWSTGGSVTDPRTGEIIKGVVTLGSLRIRQDYMIAEGLLSPYATGNETPPELEEWAVARIRQLSAHEVGHTIGLGHNYYNSTAGRISVMDYPHPLVELNSDGSLDYSEVYDTDIGEFDKVAIAYGYQDFPNGTDEAAALDRILSDAWDADVRYMTGGDTETTPQADVWANGTDMAAELNRMMDVRRAALSRFGATAIRNGRPMATIEEVLVPLYMHHRYQAESTATVVGGVGYTYAMRGDGLTPLWRVPAAQQNQALDALMRTLRPSELTLPMSVVNAIPPRPPGFGGSRELFPRYTGGSFDAITPAVVAASLTVNALLTGDRAARMVEQAALDPSLPGLGDVLGRLIDASFGARANGAYEAEVKRAVEGVVVERIEWLAANASMPQVRAISTSVLRTMQGNLMAMTDSPHATTLAMNIQRFLDRPASPTTMPATQSAPPGAPIGQPAMEWLGGFGNAGVGEPAMEWLRATQAWCPWEGDDWR
ncbi:MAG: zinc-dependent metalloprotease [Gemmatimonadetes bacterium]|nr:zinc-dependent metalloprotease [Gemmatimonadota bacterium]MDA1102311.1 zinc-dependent metalloprotease [Gemmatimonadota bacterium]